MHGVKKSFWVAYLTLLLCFIAVSNPASSLGSQGDSYNVHACIENITSLARIVEPNESCSVLENRVDWINNVSAGDGIILSATDSAKVISVDSDSIQERVTGTCAAGSAFGTISSDGSVSCNTFGSGNIAAILTSGGLTGGGVSGSLTLSVLDDGITSTKLATNAVTNEKIADNAITSSKIATAAVTTTNVSDNAITLPKMSSDAVGSEQIIDGAIIDDDLSDGSVTIDKISNDASESNRISEWYSATNQVFSSTGNNHTVAGPVIDPQISVTVPTGKAFYYMVSYDGSFFYDYTSRTGSQTSFYGVWTAEVLANTTKVGNTKRIVRTGYRETWDSAGGNNFWVFNFSPVWVVRLTEGTYDIKIQIRGYSDGTMNQAGLQEQNIQVMRIL